MTDSTNKGRNLDDALNRLYQDWNEQVSAPRLTYMNIREHLGDQERPSLLSQATAPIGSLAAKWRIPVTKSQIGSITAVATIIVLVAIYIIIIGPGSNDAEEVVPVDEPTATAVPQPTPTEIPVPTSTPGSTPEPTIQPVFTATTTPSVQATKLPDPTQSPATPTPEPTATRVPLPTAVPTATPDPLELTTIREFPPVVPDLDTVPQIAIPSDLLPGAESLSSDALIANWTELLTGMRVVYGGSIFAGVPVPEFHEFGDTDQIFCEGGRGFYIGLPDFTPTEHLGQVFTWSVTHSPAGAWYSPIINTQAENSTVWVAINTAENTDGGALYRKPLSVSAEEVLVDGGFQFTVHEAGNLTDFCSSLPPQPAG